jgi:hypothetical protein
MIATPMLMTAYHQHCRNHLIGFGVFGALNSYDGFTTTLAVTNGAS